MTEREKQKQQTPRWENHRRLQRSRAQAVPGTAGISVSFAALPVGTNGSDTDQSTRRFCAACQETSSEDVRNQQPPVVTPPVSRRIRRGVQRIR